MSDTPTPVLAAYDIAKTYQDGDLSVEVLVDITLTVNPGECVAIMGPSGSGKSTLLHLLGGLEAPSRGRVLLHDHDLSQVSEVQLSRIRNHHLGFVYQFHHLLPEFNAEENVAMPLLVRGMRPALALAKAGELLAQVGLASRLQHQISQLSGGERQRVAIARAIVTQPSCVLADEPTGNLDHDTAEMVVKTLQELARTFATSVVMVTHDIQLAQQMDKTVSLCHGVLAEG
jgi:lipoprotein-releasing system ATP-binding protein